jgi:phage/plasmid-associated DNA primase
VRNATDEYLADEDTLARWIDEECSTGPTLFGVGSHLWNSFKAWATANNEWVRSRKAFAQNLKARGFAPDKSQDVRGFRGITPRAQPGANGWNRE